MHTCLVAMPWQSLELPSLPIGILATAVRGARPHDAVTTLHANVRFADEMYERSDGTITPDDYADVVEHGLFHGLGDWAFTSALYGADAWPAERYARYRAHHEIHDGPARAMRALAPDFVERLADDILALRPDLVGLTSTFMQNVPSLALAAALKRRDPDVYVAMGGGNCDGPMGPALHRNFPFVDFVVSGEGERAIVALLDALEADGSPDLLARVPGLCWRRDGEQVTNDPAAETVAIETVPTPDYDEYFAAIESTVARHYVEPKIVLEAARGCWWGARKHCTFCGLNGSTMAFRSRSPERVWDDIAVHVRRHQVLDIVMVDNIMDMGYVSTLLPRVAASSWDLRIHYEVKSNMKREHVVALANAGVVHIQPGIESLSSRVLKLMDKGVDGVTNVRLLRDCEELRVTTPWNYLYGFPDEDEADYVTIIDQMRNLHHLQPPRIATRITLERFSPYHSRPELGFAVRSPAPFYRHVYDLPTRQLMDLVYLFESEPAGIDGETEQALEKAVAEWQDAYVTSTLTRQRDGDVLVISDRRAHSHHQDHVLRERWKVAAYETLLAGHGVSSLHARLDETERPSVVELEQWMEWLLDAGLVFHDAGRYVALATADVPVRVPVDDWR